MQRKACEACDGENLNLDIINYYRATHFSAKHGIAIECRLSDCESVCLFVTFVDQDDIGWKSLKLIVKHLRSSPKAIHLIPGEHGEIWERLEEGWEKLACWSTKAAISRKRVQIEEKLLWGAYRN